MADRSKARKCKFVLKGKQKGTVFGNFCGMPLKADGTCPEHGKNIGK